MLMSFSVVNAATTLTSTSVVTATQILTETLYTGTIGSAAGKREEPLNTLSTVRYQRNAQLLGAVLQVDLPGKYSQTNVIVHR